MKNWRTWLKAIGLTAIGVMFLTVMCAGCGGDGKDGATGAQGPQGPQGAPGEETYVSVTNPVTGAVHTFAVTATTTGANSPINVDFSVNFAAGGSGGDTASGIRRENPPEEAP